MEGFEQYTNIPFVLPETGNVNPVHIKVNSSNIFLLSGLG